MSNSPSDPGPPRPIDPGLEDRIERPRSEWTVGDLVRFCPTAGIRIVSLMHVGGDGWMKSLDFAPQDEHHLRRILRAGERADGSSLFPTGIRAEHSDIVLRPRPETAFIDPFARIPTLVVRCGHARADGTPLPESPDTIVRRATERLAKLTGASLRAHGEVEFFLGKRADETDVYGADERGYHASAPFVFGQSLRRDALVHLSTIGIPVKYGHSEVGYVEPAAVGDLIWEQHEIELDLLPLPDAADAIVLAQWVLRNLAHVYGLRCNTDPLAAHRHAGNGLHVHFAVETDGPADADGLTHAARALIGGLVDLGGALMAFGNRSPDSFERLQQGKETPSAIRWGRCDRSALVRLPAVPAAVDGEPAGPATIEFRLPDGSAHPHLLLAGAAQAACHGHGLDDLDDLLARTASTAPDEAASLPAGFGEVARALEQAQSALEAGDIFPPALLDAVHERLRG